MSWEREPLLQKARLFFERAFAESRDEPTFGLWCSLGLELLARAALASISPTLLAESDKDHRFLLHALGRGAERTQRKSISTAQVFTLCATLFPCFTDEDLKAAMALANRRNDELHSGGAAFAEYQPSQWLTGFYRACRALAEALQEDLAAVIGDEEAQAAAEALKANRADVRQKVQGQIAAHRKVFEAKPLEQREEAAKRAQEQADKLAFQRHHRVACPACGSTATITGTAFGKESVEHADGEIIVRQSVSPSAFHCLACDLRLESYAELDAAGVGGHYTRKATYSPEEYYGLADPESIIAEYLESRREYDNE
jgi:hypothetical protein